MPAPKRRRKDVAVDDVDVKREFSKGMPEKSKAALRGDTYAALESPVFKGKSMTDPISTIEVCNDDLTMICSYVGQMATPSSVSQSQRLGETAYRFVQLLCRD